MSSAESASAGPANPGWRQTHASAVVALGSMASRGLMLVRASLLVAVLGATTAAADSVTLAEIVPNILYLVVAGGVLNSALVPHIVRHVETDPDKGAAFVSRIMTVFLAALAAVTILATVAAPVILNLWTSSTWRTPALEQQWNALSLLVTLTMPQLFGFGAFYLLGQVLDAHEDFAPKAWAPVLNNAVGIAVLGGYLATWGSNAGQPFTTQQVLLLGLGSTLGVALQTAALLPAVRKLKLGLTLHGSLGGKTGIGEALRRVRWVLGFVMVSSIAQVVIHRIASDATVAVAGVPGSGVTVYQDAYLFWLLPHSLLTVSLTTAMLPAASRMAVAQDTAGVAAETHRTLRLASTFAVPSALSLVVLAYPLMHLVFGFGLGANGWPAIALTLVGLAFGLVPYTIHYVCLRGFYAQEITHTPFWIQSAISAVNVTVALVLVAVGADPKTVAPLLAVAQSTSYLLGAWLVHRSLSKQLGGLPGRELIAHLGRSFLASLPGSALATVFVWLLGTSDSKIEVAFGLVLASAVAGVGFFFMAKRLGITEPTLFLDVLRHRVPGATGSPPTFDAGGEPTLLSYPDPVAYHPLHLEVPEGLEPVSDVQAGQILGERYRLDEVLRRRGGTLTWLAHDLTLSRAVLLHIMCPGDPRTLEILDQARAAASVVDTRFLRVWDAVLDEDAARHGSYIVCEYAPGQSLEMALARGPLTEVEAAWVVREVAVALASVHAEGIVHRQLNPDTVIITASGNVKLVGLLVEAALNPRPSEVEDGQARDVLALGELLYASLLGRWPGSAQFGMPAAPTDNQGRPLTPRQISPRASLTLDDIVDRILSQKPRSRASRLTTAGDIATALSAALGGVDASHHLDQRLKFPMAPVVVRQPHTWVAAATASGGSSLGPRPEASDFDEATTGSVPTDGSGFVLSQAAPAPFDEGPATEAISGSREDRWQTDTGAITGEDTRTAPFTPIPPPAFETDEFEFVQQAPIPEPSRKWMGALFGSFGVVLIASLLMVFTNQYNVSRAPAPTPGVPHAIASVRDFDPSADGGDARENPSQAALAVDGDPASAWHTERYGKSADFNGAKPGVGIVLDLGERRSVAWVTLNLGEGASVADIRVPADATATTPPMAGASSWRVVQSLPATTGEVNVKLNTAVETRFVLVYFTRLPQRDGAYQGSISQVSVTP